jgi:hypothetical protein
MVTALDKTILYRLYKPIPRRKPNLREAKDETEMADRLSAASVRTIPDLRSAECHQNSWIAKASGWNGRRAPSAPEGRELSSKEPVDDTQPSTDEELAIAIGRFFFVIGILAGLVFSVICYGEMIGLLELF